MVYTNRVRGVGLLNICDSRNFTMAYTICNVLSGAKLICDSRNLICFTPVYDGMAYLHS